MFRPFILSRLNEQSPRLETRDIQEPALFIPYDFVPHFTERPV